MQYISEVQDRRLHVAVHLKNHILVFGGQRINYRPISNRVIWKYNLYTEQWRKHVIPKSKPAPCGRSLTCASAIESDVYMFGGLLNTTRQLTIANDLWKLSRTHEGRFIWHLISITSKSDRPSSRFAHSGWEFCRNCGYLVVGVLHQLVI